MGGETDFVRLHQIINLLPAEPNIKEWRCCLYFLQCVYVSAVYFFVWLTVSGTELKKEIRKKVIYEDSGYSG